MVNFEMKNPQEDSPKKPATDTMTAWAEEVINGINPAPETEPPAAEAPILELVEETEVGDKFTVKEEFKFDILERILPKFVVSVADESSGKVIEYSVDEEDIKDAKKGLINLNNWKLIRETQVVSRPTTESENLDVAPADGAEIELGTTFTLKDGRRLRVEEAQLLPKFVVAVKQGSKPTREYIADEHQLAYAKEGFLDFSDWEPMPSRTEVNEFDPDTLVWYDGSVHNIEEVDENGKLQLFNPETGKRHLKVEKSLVQTILNKKTKKPERAKDVEGTEVSLDLEELEEPEELK